VRISQLIKSRYDPVYSARFVNRVSTTPGGEVLFYLHFTSYHKEGNMQTILKVIFFFVGLFVIANGVWIVYMPPYGDEPIGLAIIAVGIFIPIITLFVAKMSERRYD
jgi:hypothetical protein